MNLEPYAGKLARTVRVRDFLVNKSTQTKSITQVAAISAGNDIEVGQMVRFV